MTKNTSKERGQDKIVATQCTAMAKQPVTEVAARADAAREPIEAPPVEAEQPVTEVATTADAARELIEAPPMVAEQPATEVATTADAAREPIEAPPSPLNYDAFCTVGRYGDTRNEEAANDQEQGLLIQ